MPKITVTRGLPGSGKSKWAREYGEGVPVERDMLRMELFGKWWTGNPDDEEQVTKLQMKRVKGLLKLGMSPIISDTNLPDRSVKRWQQVAYDAGVDFEVKDFRHVDLDTVLEWNESRNRYGKVVPREVILDKHKRFIEGRDLNKHVVFTPKVSKELEVVPYEQPSIHSYPISAVIFDIDGTLAVMGDRNPYDGAKVWMDTVNMDVHLALYNAQNSGAKIIIVTGRDEIYREVTEKWLEDNRIRYDALYMRPTQPAGEDKIEDSIVKYGLFNQHIRDRNYLIAGVYDDRHRVLRMWRKLGLTTFHVNGPDAGDF